jgi:hypothetical protein
VVLALLDVEQPSAAGALADALGTIGASVEEDRDLLDDPDVPIGLLLGRLVEHVAWVRLAQASASLEEAQTVERVVQVLRIGRERRRA